MIAVDTNLLVYAHRPDTAFHDAARSVMRRLAEAGAMWAIPWPCIHEFLATVTRPTVWSDPTPTAHAVSYTHLTLPTRDLVSISVVAVSLKKKRE